MRKQMILPIAIIFGLFAATVTSGLSNQLYSSINDGMRELVVVNLGDKVVLEDVEIMSYIPSGNYYVNGKRIFQGESVGNVKMLDMGYDKALFYVTYPSKLLTLESIRTSGEVVSRDLEEIYKGEGGFEEKGVTGPKVSSSKSNVKIGDEVKFHIGGTWDRVAFSWRKPPVEDAYKPILNIFAINPNNNNVVWYDKSNGVSVPIGTSPEIYTEEIIWESVKDPYYTTGGAIYYEVKAKEVYYGELNNKGTDENYRSAWSPKYKLTVGKKPDESDKTKPEIKDSYVPTVHSDDTQKAEFKFWVKDDSGSATSSGINVVYLKYKGKELQANEGEYDVDKKAWLWKLMESAKTYDDGDTNAILIVRDNARNTVTKEIQIHKDKPKESSKELKELSKESKELDDDVDRYVLDNNVCIKKTVKKSEESKHYEDRKTCENDLKQYWEIKDNVCIETDDSSKYDSLTKCNENLIPNKYWTIENTVCVETDEETNYKDETDCNEGNPDIKYCDEKQSYIPNSEECGSKLNLWDRLNNITLGNEFNPTIFTLTFITFAGGIFLVGRIAVKN